MNVWIFRYLGYVRNFQDIYALDMIIITLENTLNQLQLVLGPVTENPCLCYQFRKFKKN